MSRTLQAIKHRLTNPRRDARSFAVAIVVALLVMPVAEALAYFSATGTGTISGAQVASATSTVAITIGGGTQFSYSNGGSALTPGSSVTFPLRVHCTAGCPAFVSTISLAGFTSNHAGCNSSALPGSLTAPVVTVNAAIGASDTDINPMTVTLNNLPSTSQDACSGAVLDFQLSSP